MIRTLAAAIDAGPPTPLRERRLPVPCRLPAGGRRLSRAGYSLVEMLVAMGVFSVIVSSVAVSLHLVFRVDRQLRNDLRYAIVLPRLAGQFRSDAHRAERVVLFEDQSGVTFALPGGRSVEYRLEAQAILRTARRGAEVLHREPFRLAAEDSCRWELGSPPRALVSLRLDHRSSPGTGSQAPTRTRVIEAAVGILSPGAVGFEQEDAR